MEQPIKHSEIIQPGNPFADVEKGIKELLKQLTKLEAALKGGIANEISKLQKASISSQGGRAEISNAAKTYDEYSKKLNAVNNLKIKAAQVSDELLKSEIRLKEQARQRLKNLQDQVKVEGLAANSVDRMRVKMNSLIREYDRADASMRSKLEPRIKNYQRLITQAEQSTGRFQRQVGKYHAAFSQAGQALKSFALGIVGFTAVLSTGMRMIRNAVSTVLYFDQAMADVGAISRASVEDLSMLRQSAKELGATTKFTAVQVAGLQKNLALLGYTTTEILNSTNAILSLAAATGEDLAESALIAGAVLRAFNLDAREMTRVTDVMARSFTGSALNLNKFGDSMKMVAPVAFAFGFSVEETTALLGTLANAGFDASMAGTALRNIMLNLANTNGKLAKKLGGTVNTFDEFIPALIKLRDSGVKLNSVLEITDRRSVAAFSRFLAGAEFVRGFREELDRARGSADEMARKQLDTLNGDLIILRSAWDGLTIATRDNTDVNDTARGATQLLTEAIGEITPKAKEAESGFKKWFKEIKDGIVVALIPFWGQLKYIQKLLLWFEGRDKPLIETESTNVGLSEMEERLKIVAQEKALQELLDEQAMKEMEELSGEWLERQEKIDALRKIIDDYKKKTDNEEAERLKQKNEMAEAFADADAEREAAEIAQSDRLLQQDLKFTDEKYAAIDKANKEKEASDKEYQQFQQASMMQGLAGLDEFAKKRGIILNAQVLADQIRGLAQTIIALTVGTAKTAAVGFPQNIPLLIGFAGQVAGLISTLRSVKIGGTKYEKGGSGLIREIIESNITDRFSSGGSGMINNIVNNSIRKFYASGGSGELSKEGTILQGERHYSGGVNLGAIGEAERGEYFGIVNRPMTQFYRDDLPQVFETLNKGTFHNVFTRANELHETHNRTTLNQDPYTKKMYQLMKNQPAVYSDSDGNQVLLWPTGRKRVIRA